VKTVGTWLNLAFSLSWQRIYFPVSNLCLRSGLSVSTPCVFLRCSLIFAGAISPKRHDLRPRETASAVVAKCDMHGGALARREGGTGLRPHQLVDHQVWPMECSTIYLGPNTGVVAQQRPEAGRHTREERARTPAYRRELPSPSGLHSKGRRRSRSEGVVAGPARGA
jgi:hypothetical protein